MPVHRYMIPAHGFSFSDAIATRDIMIDLYSVRERKTVRENGKTVAIVVGTAKPIPESDLRDLGLSGALSDGNVKALLAGNLPAPVPVAAAA